MALDTNRLGDDIRERIDALADKTDRTAIFRAIGAAIVAEITGHAEVASTVAVTSVGGVTPGGGTSGPGAGTATGTVS